MFMFERKQDGGQDPVQGHGNHRRQDQGPDGAPLAMAGRQLRFVAAMAHSIPGVTMELSCTGGSTMTVARCRLDAQLDPCQFRSIVLSALHGPRPAGLSRFLEAVVGVRVVSGIDHLGGGVYRSCGEQAEHRWFLTDLDHQGVVEILEDGPIDSGEDAVTATVLPDPCLGITAVRLDAAHPAAGPELDRVAWWLAGEAMVAELIMASRSEPR